MAVVNVKSVAITNADGQPKILNPRTSADGDLREDVGVLAAVSGDSIGSTYRFVRLKSSSRVSQVLLKTTAITTCAADFGLYRTNDDGGAVVDADFFASAQSLATAAGSTPAAPALDITHESAVFPIASITMPLWLALGLAADPGIWYDVTATLTAAAGSAGTIAVITRSVNNT